MSEYKNDYNDKVRKQAKAIYQDFPDICLAFFSGKKAPLTQLAYARHLRTFFEFLYENNVQFHKPFKQFTATDFDSVTFIDADKFALTLSDLKPATQKHYRSTLLSFFNYLLGRKYITTNPFMTGGEVAKNPDAATDIHYLTHDEQLLFLEVIGSGRGLNRRELAIHDKNLERDMAICYLLLATGIRVSELVGIDVEDVDLQNCSVSVARKGRQNKPDTVYMSDSALEVIKEYLCFREQIYSPALGEHALFLSAGVNKKGEDGEYHKEPGRRISVRAVERLVKKYVRHSSPQKEMEISPHKLRTSFAMTMLKATDNDLLAVSRMLNHSGLGTVKRYVEASDETRKMLRNLTDL